MKHIYRHSFDTPDTRWLAIKALFIELHSRIANIVPLKGRTS